MVRRLGKNSWYGFISEVDCSSDCKQPLLRQSHAAAVVWFFQSTACSQIKINVSPTINHVERITTLVILHLLEEEERDEKIIRIIVAVGKKTKKSLEHILN